MRTPFNKKLLFRKIGMLSLVLLASLGTYTLVPTQIAHAQTYNGKPTSATNYAVEDSDLCEDPKLFSAAVTTETNDDGSITTCKWQLGGILPKEISGTITFPNSPGSSIQLAANNSGGQSATVINTSTGAPAGPATDITGLTQTLAPIVKAAAPVVAPIASAVGTAITDALSGLVASIALALLGLTGFLLGLVGSLFNWIVVITVFQFGAYFGNSAGLLLAWGILRDVGNILLLFGFIFMGVIMILDLHTIDTRAAIPRLIIVALLLNFSLFAAEAVIDVSNVLSAALYTQAGNAGCAANSPAATCANTGIAALVVNATGLNTVFTSPSGFGGAINSITDNPTHAMIVYVGLTLFVTVTMVVLLAATIMLVIRAIVLVFVMVLAPLGFAAMAIPPLAKLGDQWRSTLIKEAFFAPVYLLLLLVSLKIMQALKTSLTGSANATLLTALSNPTANSGTMVIIFVLIIGFMIASLMAAKQLGAIGANYATNFSTKFAGAATLGATGFVGRRTVGRASGAIASRIRGSSFGETGMGRYFAGVADKGANSSFDARSLKSVKSIAGAGKFDLGAPSKDAAHGYHGIEKAAIDARTKHAATLTSSRKQTGKEWEASKQKAQEELEATEAAANAAINEKLAASNTAVADKAARQATYNESLLQSQSAAAETVKQESILAHIKTQAAQNPTDATLAKRVVDQNQKLVASRNNQIAAERLNKQHENELKASDVRLTAANNALAKSRTDEAAKVTAATAKKKGVDEERGTVGAKERKQIYADNIEHEFAVGVTVSKHANHAAASKIRTNADKSKLDNALDTLKEEIAAKEKADSHSDGHGGGGGAAHAPAPAPKGGGHGGGGHGGGGGGGHH